MAAFLKNLPSFNQDNFSRFQKDLYKYPPKKQSIYACHKEDPNEAIIINQNCNLLIQYLEKQIINDKAKKRDIGQTMPISDDTDMNSANNKKIKKRKFQSNAQCDDATIQQD